MQSTPDLRSVGGRDGGREGGREGAPGGPIPGTVGETEVERLDVVMLEEEGKRCREEFGGTKGGEGRTGV